MSVAIIRNVRTANTPNCTLRFLAPLIFTLTLLTSSSCISQKIQLDKIKLPRVLKSACMLTKCWGLVP